MPPILLFIILLIPWAAQGGEKNRHWAENPVAFKTARKSIYEMYQEHGWSRSFYCACPFDPATRRADPRVCGFKDPNYASDPDRPFGKLAEVVQVEHVVPASAFGPKDLNLTPHFDACQGKPNRRSCYERVNLDYKRMHANPYNLVPVLGALNNYRQDLVMGEVQGENQGFGGCNFELDRKNNRVEPRPEVRGDVARIYFYMEKTYPAVPIINPQARDIYRRWDREDPLDSAECERAAAIKAKTGMVNDVIEVGCKTLGGGK